MNSLENKLKTHYPFINNDWTQFAIPLLVVFATLYLFRPFGLSSLNNELLILRTAFSFSFFSAFVNYLANYILKYTGHYFLNTEQWTVGKNIILDGIKLMFIAISVLLCGLMLNTWTFSAEIFLKVVLMVVVVSIFPITITTFKNQNILLKEHLKSASQINEAIPNKTPKTLQLQIGDFSLNSEYFMYAEACGNYVTVTYIEEDVVKQKMIRTTLKTIRESDKIVRCHRAYYVNLNKVIQASGNSQGLRLKINNVSIEIPVSRAYTSIIKNKIRL